MSNTEDNVRINKENNTTERLCELIDIVIEATGCSKSEAYITLQENCCDLILTINTLSQNH